MARKAVKHTIRDTIILIIALPLMYILGLWAFLGYLIAIGFSLYKGLLWKRRGIARMIIVGVILSLLAGIIFFLALDSVQGGSYLSAAIMIFIGVLIWNKSRKMKHGKR